MTERASQKSSTSHLRAVHVLSVDGGRKVMAQAGVSAPIYRVPF
jgi:hypothetical protein